jgi:competence ComEA-like helix-hairpin-helix protein
MANGYFERGEIYWVRMDNGFGGEQGVGRPGLIISRDTENNQNDTVTVAFLTTKYYPTKKRVMIEATGTTSYVIHNQLMTYDKSRLTKCIGVLNSAEQKAVDDVLEEYLDLGYVDDTAIKEKESEIADLNLLVNEARAETATVKAEIAKRDEEIASLKMEIEMWQKCYGRCMDMLVDTKVNADLSRRTTVVEPKVGTAAIPDLRPEPPVVEEPKVEQPEPPVDPVVEEPSEKRLDINSCTATALKKVGFSLAIARKIVESRPFSSVEDIKRVNGLKSSLFRVVEPKLCCVPVKEEPVIVPKQEPDPGFEKLNLNTATAMELHKVCGMPQTTAYSVTGYRNKNGPFQSVEDLLKVKQVAKSKMSQYREFLEV